jgi:hypothetical protein
VPSRGGTATTDADIAEWNLVGYESRSAACGAAKRNVEGLVDHLPAAARNAHAEIRL